MIRYILKQITNPLSKVVNRWFAYVATQETVDLAGLARHMASHNTPFSAGVVKGLLTDMVNCIKELLLEGKNVKIDDLAIFSLGIKNAKGGAEKEEDFNVSQHIEGVRFRARATGVLMPKNLNLEATMKKARLVNDSTAGSTSDTGTDWE